MTYAYIILFEHTHATETKMTGIYWLYARRMLTSPKMKTRVRASQSANQPQPLIFIQIKGQSVYKLLILNQLTVVIQHDRFGFHSNFQVK